MTVKKKTGKSATATGADLKEFRKTNEAIGLRVSEGRLSLLSRKIFNVMVYHAQRIRNKGENAPIDSEVAKNYYWIPLSELARDAAYDSRDTELFKEQVQELQNIRIFSEDAIQWTSERLVSSVKLVNPRGLKKQGGMLWFGFAFPPEVESMVMAPGSYTKLSVYYQALLRSGASLALYEICRRYATNPSRVTNRAEWEWWYGALTGNPVGESIPEYKYFKRDVLKYAITEINMVTDINVELIEHKQGRRVASLQFKVTPAQQESLALSAPPVIDGELVKRMMALGLSQEDACNLLATTEDGKLRATLDLTEARLRNPKAAKVTSPAGYFKQALRDGYASNTDIARKNVQKIENKPSVEASINAIRERYIVERAKDAMNLYEELEAQEKAEWMERFKESESAKGMNLARGLASATARSAFSHWFATQQWPEPTDSDLLAFAAVSSMQGK
ncbi:replication initiation protein [Noviherbaspirillum pedocola]|uniref:Replication initiation protein n=1 Tax=Noviherbaspirillum pedocola TaxID=2801341 RepID=A0A934SYF0_9BURK|nr:replication initiation protein [Noviherbaspirillum pedocola]MBK4737974.1 replication initiation protein [Noviherbaspirillum pedocola]